MEQNKNSESPDSPASGPSQSPAPSGPDGGGIRPTHPDHGPMHLIPRQSDGSIAAYYYCSRAELDDAGLPAPPPRRRRRDGFTAERQEEFLEHLRGGASGREAARRIGISPTTAYNLYNSPDGAHFARAWDEAARVTDIVLEDTAFDRAVNGQEEIVFHKGEPVGTRWKYDNNLLMKLLRARLPLKYAPLSEIEGWLRHRGIAPPANVDGAIDRLREAESEWGRRLPGEETPARLADESAGGPRPPVLTGEGLGPDPSCPSAAPRPCPGREKVEEGSDASTSSTSPDIGRPEGSDDASTSSTSPPAAEPPADPEGPACFRPPPLPRIRLL